MFDDSKSKFRTRSIRLATTRNYMEGRRLGQTILQYQKECRGIMKQLRDKQYSFLKAKYPHIVARNSLINMAKRENHTNAGCNENKSNPPPTKLMAIWPATNARKEMITTGKKQQGTVKHLSSKNDRMHGRQKSTISLPSLTEKRIGRSQKLEVRYVPTRLPPLDELHS